MSRRGLTKFDKSFLSNDGGKYSPSIRRFRQRYLHDTKVFATKALSPPAQSSFMTTQISDSRSSTSHHQSSIDLIATPLKCDDCQKHDGLFQCCHCNQRLCIRCCNKHYKKVTAELEYLHEERDCLLTKIIHTKNDLERQKNETIEQCHKWRIDTMNKINKAHTLIIQTIHDEYEILGKEYDLLVEKEMSHINIDKNELIRMKKGNLSSILSSSSSSSTTTIYPTNSMDIIKKRIETFAKYIDDTEKFSFQVKLPIFVIGDKLSVESRLGDIIRSTSATWQHEDFINDKLSTKSDEKSKKESSPNSPLMNVSLLQGKPTENDIKLQPDRYEATSSSTDSSVFNQHEDNSSSSIGKTNSDNERDDSFESQAIQLQQTQPSIEIIRRRRAITVPYRSSSNTERLSNDYPCHHFRTNSPPSYIQ